METVDALVYNLLFSSGDFFYDQSFGLDDLRVLPRLEIDHDHPSFGLGWSREVN